MAANFESGFKFKFPDDINRFCYLISLVCIAGGTIAALMLIWLGLESQVAIRSISTMFWLLCASLFTAGVNSAFAYYRETTVDQVCFVVCLACTAFATLMGIILIWIDAWHTFAWKALSSSFVVFCASIITVAVHAAFKGKLNSMFSGAATREASRGKRSSCDELVTIVQPHQEPDRLRF